MTYDLTIYWWGWMGATCPQPDSCSTASSSHVNITSRWTYICGLVAKEVDSVQAFTLQKLETQSLVPALRKNIKTDETT